MAWGGKRPGAGKPKGKRTLKTLNREAMRKRLEERVAQELDPILDAQLELAKVVLIQKTTPEGERIYREKPDHNAAKTLIDQSIGRAPETIDVNQKTMVAVIHTFLPPKYGSTENNQVGTEKPAPDRISSKQRV